MCLLPVRNHDFCGTSKSTAVNFATVGRRHMGLQVVIPGTIFRTCWTIENFPFDVDGFDVLRQILPQVETCRAGDPFLLFLAKPLRADIVDSLEMFLHVQSSKCGTIITDMKSLKCFVKMSSKMHLVKQPETSVVRSEIEEFPAKFMKFPQGFPTVFKIPKICDMKSQSGFYCIFINKCILPQLSKCTIL